MMLKPCSAAMRIVGSLKHATYTGGRGFCTGFGTTVIVVLRQPGRVVAEPFGSNSLIHHLLDERPGLAAPLAIPDRVVGKCEVPKHQPIAHCRACLLPEVHRVYAQRYGLILRPD